MSSVIFQPLLHDPLGWKPCNSTYADHYKWRKHRITSKDKKVSTYGQQYQRKLQKQQQKLLNRSLPATLNEKQTNQSVILEEKPENNQERPGSNRTSSAKTAIVIVEHKERPPIPNEEAHRQSKASFRSTATLPVVEDEIRPLTAPEVRPLTKEKEKEKERPPINDPNNDNSRHWLTYPNPRTPQYIIDIKERLGQLRIPPTLARPTSASSASVEQKPATLTTVLTRPSSASTQVAQKRETTNDDQRSFLSYQVRETPDELRAIRYRIDKYRYNPSLDSYPPRPKTCPANVHNNQKSATPKQAENQQVTEQTSKQIENQQAPVQTPKNDVWTVAVDEKASNKPDFESSSSILIQMVDCDGLPNEYYEALETASLAQEEYLRNLKKEPERRPENPVYRLATPQLEHRNDSSAANQNQQQSEAMSNQLRQLARSSQNNFGAWVRNATEKERASTMKILHEVLNQPIMGYDIPTKQKPTSKQAPVPPPARSASAPRKLGRTRTQHHFPCEICEKLLIKRHIWDLNGSEIQTCPNHPQGIQVQA